jgi:two-component system, chemotaxis family, response regulator Rcp1
MKTAEILLVEDNITDIKLIEEALREYKVNNNLYTVRDGIEALDFLYRKGKYEKAIRPDLIILDLNLPKKDGIEVLEEIKSDEELKRIPVVILSTSGAEPDIMRTYNLHANCYIQKPLGFNDFIEVVKSIEHFWLTAVKQPLH